MPVELLAALLRRLPAAGVLLALAHRPRMCPERLMVALERTRPTAALTRIELWTRELEVALLVVGRKTNPQDRRGAPPQQEDGRDPPAPFEK